MENVNVDLSKLVAMFFPFLYMGVSGFFIVRLGDTSFNDDKFPWVKIFGYTVGIVNMMIFLYAVIEIVIPALSR